MKGRTKTQTSPEEQQNPSEDVVVNVNENDGSDAKEQENLNDAPDNDGKNDGGEDNPSETKENKKNDYGGLSAEFIANAIKHNPQYSEFYLNSKGFVFVPDTSKRQMGEDAVLIKVKDFK